MIGGGMSATGMKLPGEGLGLQLKAVWGRIISYPETDGHEIVS